MKFLACFPGWAKLGFHLLVYAAIGSAIGLSLSRALIRSRGAGFTVDQSEKTVEVATSGSIVATSFRFLNRSGRSVKIVGADSSCACTLVSNLPATVRDNSAYDLAVTIDTSDKKNGDKETITVITDHKVSRFIPISVAFHFRSGITTPK